MIISTKVYQFNVSLKSVKPKIWRRVQVPETYTFWDMHVAIQDLMPWEDYHLHQFMVKSRSTGEMVIIGTPANVVGVDLAERDAKLKDFFIAPKDKGEYLYDFGLGWLHNIVLEAIIPAVPGVTYPRCTAGKKSCFPEDGVGDPPDVEFDHTLVEFKDPEEYWISRHFHE